MNFLKILTKYWFWFTLFVLCLIPVIWFVGKGNVLITGLDTNFPLDPLVWFKRRFFVWNGINNAGVDFSSSVAGLFFHFVQLVPFLLRFPLKFVEIVSLVFWFSAIVASSFFLAKTISPKNRVSQIILVVLYSLNIYLFNTWENVKVSNLALVSALPIFVATAYLWMYEKIEAKKAIIYLCLVSILASGAGINPAYFSVIVLVLLIEMIVIFLSKYSVKKERKALLRKGLITFLVFFLVNLFWIIPLFNFLYSINSASLTTIGLTNWLESLSENTSIINVIRLQGAWDWYALDNYGMPQYLPYTLNYLYQLPFVIFSFCVPLLALISFLFSQKEKSFWYIFFGILTLLGIFLGVGAHPPTGSMFLFLVEHIPFLSFFRSPWYIFTPILTLSYAGLVCLLYESISGRVKKKFVVTTLFVLFLISYAFYNYPLITGKIFRPSRKDGFYVSFPQYVWDAKDWLASDNSQRGRIISYPDDQLEAFEWGYQGTESILSLYSDREVITPSFNVASKTFSEILNNFYSQIKRKNYKSAISYMNLVGADEIFYKKDSPSLSSKIGEDINGLVDTTSFGGWFFLRPKTQMNSKIFAASGVYNNLSNQQDFVSLTPLLPYQSIVVSSRDTEVENIGQSDKFPVLLKAGVLNEDESELSNSKVYEFSLLRSGAFNIVIEKDFVNNLFVKVDSNEVDNSLINFEESLISVGPIQLSSGTHRIEVVYPPTENLLALSSFESLSNISELRSEELPLDIQKTLVAYSESEEPQEIMLPINNFNPYLRYAVGFDYKYLYGKVPFVEVLQSAPTSPVKTYPIYPGSSMDWKSRYDIYRPVETESKLEFQIKMGVNQYAGRSKSFFENIFIKRIYDNKVFVIEDKKDTDQDYLSRPEINFKKISPVKYEIELTGQSDNQNGTIIAFLENYNKGWSIKSPDTNSQLKLTHFMINGYGNGWYIPAASEGSRYIIYYKYQYLYLVGVIISVGTVSSIFVWSFLKRKRND